MRSSPPLSAVLLFAAPLSSFSFFATMPMSKPISNVYFSCRDSGTSSSSLSSSLLLRWDQGEGYRGRNHCAAPRRCNHIMLIMRPMSLKATAEPLLDSGKAMAKSGELLIDLTSTMGKYGGGLSLAGANVRNSGDCIAQAAVSCRFKTGRELVCNELREAATCLVEASDKLKSAIREAQANNEQDLASHIEAIVLPMRQSGQALESAGEGIMKNELDSFIGERLTQTKKHLLDVALGIGSISIGAAHAAASKDTASNAYNPFETKDICEDLSHEIRQQGPQLQPHLISSSSSCEGRMKFASERMIQAGKKLIGIKDEVPKDKAWLKGRGV